MVEVRANGENGGLAHFEASVRNDVFLFLKTRIPQARDYFIWRCW